MSEVANKILFTTNYDMFHLSKYNRKINKPHLDELCNAIEINNQLDINPILVNSEFEVVNGQHRLAAAKKLGVPIFYIQKATDQIPFDYFLHANMHQRQTKVLDAVNHYADFHDNEDYKVLKECIKLLKIAPSSVGALISQTDDTVYAGKCINNGNFKIAFSREVTFDLVNKYKNLIDICKGLPFAVKSIWTTTHFCLGFKCFYKFAQIDWQRFEKKLRMHWKLLDVKLYGRDQWLLRFIEIYNKRATANIVSFESSEGL